MSSVDPTRISWQSFSDLAKELSSIHTAKGSTDVIIDFVKDADGNARLIHTADSQTYNFHRAGEIRAALVSSISTVLKDPIPEDVLADIGATLGYRVDGQKDEFLISDKMLSERDFLSVMHMVEKQLAKTEVKGETKAEEKKTDEVKGETKAEEKKVDEQPADKKIDDEKGETKVDEQKTEEVKGETKPADKKIDDEKVETKVEPGKTEEVKGETKAEEKKVEPGKAEEKKSEGQVNASGRNVRQERMHRRLEEAYRSGVYKGPKSGFGRRMARPFKALFSLCAGAFSSLVGLFRKWTSSVKKPVTNPEVKPEVKVEEKKVEEGKTLLRQKCEDVLERLEKEGHLAKCFLGVPTEENKEFMLKRIEDHFEEGKGSGIKQFGLVYPDVDIKAATAEQLFDVVTREKIEYTDMDNGVPKSVDVTFLSGCRDAHVTNVFIEGLRARVKDAKVGDGDGMDAAGLQRLKDYMKDMLDSEINEAFCPAHRHIESKEDLDKEVSAAFTELSTKMQKMNSIEYCCHTVGEGEVRFVGNKSHPKKETVLKTGTYFGQNSNTCFMMSYVNALLSTDDGTKIVQDYLAKAEFVEAPENFSSFEAQLMSDYKHQMELALGELGKEEAAGEHLGKQGLGNYMGLVFGFDQPASMNFVKGREDMQRRDDWFKVVEALRNKPELPVVLFQGNTDPNARYQGGHYMAVVGTYLKKDGDFGFVVRDSLNSKTIVSAKKNNDVVIYQTTSRAKPMAAAEPKDGTGDKVDDKLEPKREEKAEDKPGDSPTSKVKPSVRNKKKKLKS